jgi:hypothetical protein
MDIKDFIRSGFPNLKDFNVIDGNFNPRYNCISYEFGDTTTPWWPIKSHKNEYWPTNISQGLYINSFNDLFKLYNYVSCKNDDSFDINHTKIALFSKNGIPTHACKQKDSISWTSKLGDFQVIEHNLYEIQGETYGYILEIFKKI